ncbi:MAG TPA: 2-hydroxychromene-2-carboxylate isomerase [Burkholderiales bacterium]|nr:2-hydroxychromene-2-carboxylate isomerase [Burkholderiales bacterium]
MIDYYFSPMSPWTYLGHARFADIARKHNASIAVKPVDFMRIFSVSGGLPLAKRAPQRQKYRLTELQRWRDYLHIQLTLQPKYFPFDTQLASNAIIAARTQSEAVAMKLSGAILQACWAEERNMADVSELRAVIAAQGLDPAALLSDATQSAAKAEYERLTDEAIARDVFGAPTYIYRDELFWGQDRLDMLDWRMSQSR